MWILLLSLVALAVVAYVASLLSHRSSKDASDNAEAASVSEQCDSQCGNGTCDVECLLSNPSAKIVYFEDEELDAFKGRPSGEYTEDEAEQFREVLYTMQEKEVPEWLSSLRLRGVELPDALKDEVSMIIQELLSNRQKEK